MARTYTRSELLAAYAHWEADVRADRSAFKSPEESAAMTLEQWAEASVAALESYIAGSDAPPGV